MKKVIWLSIALLILDQGIKALIAGLYMGHTAVLIPDVLLLRPLRNTELTWIASMLDVQTPVIPLVIVQLFAFAVVILLYRYSVFISKKHQGLLKGYLAFSISGILCAFIDVVFWGGSLDFLRLFDWFTFDTKDVYLSVNFALLILYYIFYMPEYKKLSKEERKQRKMARWLKQGCPVSSAEP